MKRYILIFCLILLALTGCSNSKSETVDAIEETESKPEEKKESSTNKEPDHTLINGYWKTEVTEDGRFLEFTIDYPDITNFNGIKGRIKYDEETQKYRVIFKDENGESVFYIGNISKNTGTVYYSENGNGEVMTLAMSRDPETAPENVLDDSTEQKPETTQSSSTNTGNNKPSDSNSSNNTNEKKGHYEERTVLVHEAWDEQVVVKEAWTEEQTYCAAYEQSSHSAYTCHGCGFTTTSYNEISSHIIEGHENGCDSFYNSIIYDGEPYCSSYATNYIEHPAEYKTVHHDAEYKTEMVWVED